MTSASYLKNLSIVSLALITGQIFAALAVAFVVTPENKQPEIAKILGMYVLPFILLGAFLGSKYIFEFRVKEAKQKSNLTEKLLAYQSASIVRFAMLEFPSLFAVAVFFMSVDYIFLGVTAFIVAYLLLIRPNTESIARDLNLSAEEKELLENPYTVLR